MNRKCCTFAGVGIDGYRSAVSVDDLFAKGKAEACAGSTWFDSAHHRLLTTGGLLRDSFVLCGEKRVEYPAHLRLLDAAARVADFY